MPGYIWTTEGWLYLAIVVDLYSRRIIGWEARDRMKQDLAISALQSASLNLISFNIQTVEANMLLTIIVNSSKPTASMRT